MTPGATREQARALDGAATELGVPPEMLMALAGFQSARLALDILRDSGGNRATVLVGRGNNGGDALVVARHLRDWGTEVSVVVPGALEELGPTSGLARAAAGAGARILIEYLGAESLAAVRDSDLIVDGLLGTGARGAPREPMATLISEANQRGRGALAIDIPSGLDTDTGEVEGGCLRAAHTVMLGIAKRGCLRPQAARWSGRLWLADIGIPRGAYERCGLEAPAWRGADPIQLSPPTS